MIAAAGRAMMLTVPMAIIAPQNLVDASEREGIDPPARNA
jgi:hypothetical protein